MSDAVEEIMSLVDAALESPTMRHVGAVRVAIEALSKDAERWRADCESFRVGGLGVVPYFDRQWMTAEEQGAAADAAIAAREQT